MKKLIKHHSKKSNKNWIFAILGIILVGGLFLSLNTKGNFLSYLGIPPSVNRVADYDDPLATAIEKQANDKANLATQKEARVAKETKGKNDKQSIEKRKQAEAELYIAANVAAEANKATKNESEIVTKGSSYTDIKDSVEKKLADDGIITTKYEQKEACDKTGECSMEDDHSKPIYTVEAENQAIIDERTAKYKLGNPTAGGATTPVDPSVVTQDWCKEHPNSGAFGCPYDFSWVGDEACGKSIAGYYCWDKKLYVINLPDTQAAYDKARAAAEGKLGDYSGNDSPESKKAYLNSLGIYDTATVNSLSAKLQAKTPPPAGGADGGGVAAETPEAKAAREAKEKLALEQKKCETTATCSKDVCTAIADKTGQKCTIIQGTGNKYGLVGKDFTGGLGTYSAGRPDSFTGQFSDNTYNKLLDCERVKRPGETCSPVSGGYGGVGSNGYKLVVDKPFIEFNFGSTPQSPANPTTGSRKVAKATDCNEETEKSQVMRGKPEDGGGIYCMPLEEPAKAVDDNTSNSSYGRKVVKATECNADTEQSQVRRGKPEDGGGIYCIPREIKPKDGSLIAGQDCSSGSNVSCDSGDCRNVVKPGDKQAGWYCMMRPEDEKRTWASSPWNLNPVTGPLALGWQSARGFLWINKGTMPNGGWCYGNNDPCSSGYCAKNIGIIPDTCEINPFEDAKSESNLESSLNTTGDPSITTPQIAQSGTVPALNTGPLTPDTVVSNPAGQPAVTVPAAPPNVPGSVSAPPTGLSTKGSGNCIRHGNTYCDGTRMYELYSWYRDNDGWWNEDSDLTPAEFTAMMLVAESGGDVELLQAISEASANQLWGRGNGGREPYCTSQADCKAGVLNFTGSYMESAGRRYNTLQTKGTPEDDLKTWNQYLSQLKKEGITLESIASSIVYDQKPRDITASTPTEWGSSGDPDIAKRGNCPVAFEGGGDVVYSFNQKYTWDHGDCD